jgi:hypothetical protein
MSRLSRPLLAATVASLVAFGLGCGSVTDLLEGKNERQGGKVVTGNGSSGGDDGDVDNGDPPACSPDVDMPKGKACAQAKITCGADIVGRTGARGAYFGDDFYQGMHCTPQRHRYGEAAEAVYLLTIPADIEATVHVESDCGELDVATFRFERGGACPTARDPIAQCEMDTHRGDANVKVTTVNSPEKHLVIVDGKKGDEGNFRLQVTCRTYR